MLHIVGLSGSPNEPSKTSALVRSLIERVGERLGAEPRMIDIAGLVPHLGVRHRSEASDVLENALHTIENANLLIAGSPVYKGSYTGLFKHVIDLLSYNSLQGMPVGLVATGGSYRHALVIEHQLRPLFGSFCAFTLPTGIFVADADLNEGDVQDPGVRQRIDRLVDEAVAALAASRK